MMFNLIPYILKLLTAADNYAIQVPYGENKTIWELATEPYTRYLGGFFWAIVIGVITAMIWIKTQNIGPPLLWFIAANGIMSALVSGGVQMFFMLMVVLGVVAIFYHTLTS